MRDIKFRAWDKETKEMLYDFDQKISDRRELKLGQSIHLFVYQIGLLYGTLQQYTGLKDKNGVEIYEGDVVENWEFGQVGEVSFHDGMFVTSSVKYEPSHLAGYDVEIIGNIYENPELLK